MAQGVCSGHVTSLSHLLHYHFSSAFLAVPARFETTFPLAQSLPNFTRPESAGQAHFRTSGEEFGHLADLTHSTHPGGDHFSTRLAVGRSLTSNGPITCVETGLGREAKLLGARADMRMPCAFRIGKFGKNCADGGKSRERESRRKETAKMRETRDREGEMEIKDMRMQQTFLDT